jgi:hypothetical protein
MDFSRLIGLANFAYLIFTEMQNFQYPCFSDSSVGACRHLRRLVRNVMRRRFLQGIDTISDAMFRVPCPCAGSRAALPVESRNLPAKASAFAVMT